MKKSIVAFLLLFALLIPCVLSGCVTQAGGDVTTPDGEKTGDPTSAADTTAAAPVTTPEAPITTVPSEPVDISTPEGVVLVGRIEKDECYYFVSDRKLNIKYTGMGDTPFVFDGVERLDMFDSDVDGIDKSAFVGKEVTVSGILRFVRSDFEKLYLHAYRIDNGNTAGESHAEPDITVPETEPETKYDPSIPLPEKMKIRVENGHYVYNPYILSTEALMVFGNGFADFYIEAIDAILNYKSYIPCDNDAYAIALPSVLRYEFPLCDYTFKCEDIGTANGKIKIEYLVSREEQEKMSAEMFERINEYLINALTDNSDVLNAEILYHKLVSSVTYDYKALETFMNTELYHAFIDKTGICRTFAGAYALLLTQIGIENIYASGTNSDNQGHAWNVVTLEGKRYYCDPTFENGTYGGTGFLYFGITAEERIKSGFLPERSYIGRYILSPAAEAGISEQPLKIVPIQ